MCCEFNTQPKEMGREFDIESGEGRGQCTAAPYQLGTDSDGRRLLKKIHDRCREDGDCWIWAQGVNGSGLPLMRNGSGRAINARRLALLATGNVPKDGSRATDTCGHSLCCNPEHLQFASYSQILRKIYTRGRRSGTEKYLTRVGCLLKSGQAKLDWNKAADIRARINERSADLAAEYGVSQCAIQNIWSGRSWRVGMWQGLK